MIFCKGRLMKNIEYQQMKQSEQIAIVKQQESVRKQNQPSVKGFFYFYAKGLNDMVRFYSNQNTYIQIKNQIASIKDKLVGKR